MSIISSAYHHLQTLFCFDPINNNPLLIYSFIIDRKV